MTGGLRIERVIGAVNIGSFRIAAMIAAVMENGEILVLGSDHRASQGVKHGYVTDMAAATNAVRDAVERVEKLAGTDVSGVWVACSGAGLTSRIDPIEIEIGGRRIEDDDVEHLLVCARDGLESDGLMVLHAQPASYFLDGADGVANPRGLHAERLGVDVHVMLAEGAPMRNLKEAVQNAHLEVSSIVAAPVAAGLACLSAEERDLGVALVECGAHITNVAVFSDGMLMGLTAIPRGSADITDAIASAFGIRRLQAERLKCIHGTAIASPADHREMVPVNGPGDEYTETLARGADADNRIPRAELVSVIVAELDQLAGDIAHALEDMGFSGTTGAPRGHSPMQFGGYGGAAGRTARQVVLTGGGAELTGLADYMQTALGKPVRIGRPPALKGLPEVHGVPSFTTLAGLVLYAAEDPVDIRSVGSRYQTTHRPGGIELARQVWRAMKEYF